MRTMPLIFAMLHSKNALVLYQKLSLIDDNDEQINRKKVGKALQRILNPDFTGKTS